MSAQLEPNNIYNESISDTVSISHTGRVFGILEYCVFAIVFAVLYQYKWSETARKAFHLKSFQGPQALPIIGNGHQMLFKPTEFYEWSWGLCKKYGGIALTWRLNFPMLWISNFDISMELLRNPAFLQKSQDIDMFWRQHGANGLSSTPAHLHSERRKLVYPGHMRSVVNASTYIFAEETKHLVEKLQPLAASGEVFDVLKWIMPCSFKIICRSAFGDDFIAEQTDREALRQMDALHEVCSNFTNRLMNPNLLLRNDFIYFNLTSEGRKTRAYINVINDFGTMAIQRKRDKRKQNPNKEQVNLCYLDLILNLCDNGELDEKFVLGEINNYVAGGYDPTAFTIAWTLFALALNDPCHQQKIADELNEIFEGAPIQDWNITAADTKKMKYLELCVKEALRLFPTAPVFLRSTCADMKLKDGRVIPSGTDIFIMADMIHRDPKYFTNPDKFLPERHLEPNPAYLPFSVGVRNCIGQVYAMHQVKVELAGMLREYIWETVDDEQTLPRVFQGFMVPINSIHFRIKKRSYKK